jgi:hypothetical protein
VAHYGPQSGGVGNLPQRTGRHLWWRPPGWLFHAAWLLPVAWLLWATSSRRGLSITSALLVVGAVGLLGCLWLGRLATYVAARSGGRARGHPVWFAVMPVICGLLAAAVVTDASFRARWALSRSSFEGVVHDARWNTSPQEEPSCFAASPADDQLGRVGLFESRSVRMFGDAAVVLVGGDDGAAWGFAYVPDGWPDDLQVWEAACFAWREGPGDLFYEDLGGDWYMWDSAIDLRASDSDPDPESKSMGSPPGQ